MLTTLLAMMGCLNEPGPRQALLLPFISNWAPTSIHTPKGPITKIFCAASDGREHAPSCHNIASIAQGSLCECVMLTRSIRLRRHEWAVK